MVGAAGMFGLGTGAALTPDITLTTKIALGGAAIASASWSLEGWNQMRGFGVSGYNPIQEGAGWYGRSVAGLEGEMWARRMMSVSQFAFGMAGGMGGTNIGNARFNLKNFKSWGGTAKGAFKADYVAARQALHAIYRKWIVRKGNGIGGGLRYSTEVADAAMVNQEMNYSCQVANVRQVLT